MVSKSAMKTVDFAKHINMTRDGVYKIYEKDAIATDLLQKISKVLNHDFFAYYQSNLNLEEEENPYGYAEREEFEKLSGTVNELIKAVNSLQQEIARQSAPKKSRSGKHKKKK